MEKLFLAHIKINIFYGSLQNAQNFLQPCNGSWYNASYHYMGKCMVCTAPMAYDKVYYTVTGVRGKMVGVMQ